MLQSIMDKLLYRYKRLLKCAVVATSHLYKMKEKKLLVNKRARSASRDVLLQWSKEELVDKVLQLEAHNFQLKNILQKKLGKVDSQCEQQLESDKAKEPQQAVTTDKAVSWKKQKRSFDFSKSNKRHVLLKILYFGWDYHGLACQEDSNATIEHHLFKALIRTCLIESRATSNYHRCGRTDKEVSALCQVISIDLRSKLTPAQQLEPDALENEIDYCTLLNRVLPHNIQAVAWMPLRHKAYSARFDCTTRTYRYYFPCGDLNIKAMQEGCQFLVRNGDFRNFCKMDVNNGVTNYMRHVQKAVVQRCENAVSDKPSNEIEKGYSMYMLEIKSNAFLWHQIRCIMAVLQLIGQGKEDPSVINELFDVESHPCKPQYSPAIGFPLSLYDCEFRKHTERTSTDEATTEQANENQEQLEHTTAWFYSKESLLKLIETVQSEWASFNIKCTMIRDALYYLEQLFTTHCSDVNPVQAQSWLLQDGVKTKQYQKLLNRKRCESLENRIEHYVKKQRLIVQTDSPSAQEELASEK